MPIFILFTEVLLLFVMSQFLTRSLSRHIFSFTGSQKATINLISAIFLPGVIIHELSHFFSAAVLQVHVGDIDFVPKVDGNRVRLGSVEIGKTDPLRRAIIGFAPVLVGASIIISSLYFFSTLSNPAWYAYVVLLFVVFEVGNTMFSSRKDVEGTLELLLIFIFIGVFLYFLGFRIPQGFFAVFQNQDLLNQIAQINLFLLVPLGIDFAILSLIGLLSKRRKF